MALNNLLNLPPSKIALKPPPPTRPSLLAPPRQPAPNLSFLRSEAPPPPQRVHSSASQPPDAAPSSTEEAVVAQALSRLAAALQKPLNNSVPLKKLKKQRQARFRAEIPVVDDSTGSLARLAFDVFVSGGGVPRKRAPARLLLVWPSADALAVALLEFKNWGDSTTLHAQLDDDAVAPDALSACDAAVFLAPAQVEKMKTAAMALDPKPVVLFNPAWSFDEEDEAFDASARDFVASFNVVHSFTGLEVRGLLSKKRGVLLRCVGGGAFGGESWVLMVEGDDGAEGQEFKVVSRLKRRPTIGEVETMLLLRCVGGGAFGGESWVLMVEGDDGAEGQEFKVVSRLKRRPTIGEVDGGDDAVQPHGRQLAGDQVGQVPQGTGVQCDRRKGEAVIDRAPVYMM